MILLQGQAKEEECLLQANINLNHHTNANEGSEMEVGEQTAKYLTTVQHSKDHNFSADSSKDLGLYQKHGRTSVPYPV